MQNKFNHMCFIQHIPAIRFAIVPLGTKRPLCFPNKSAIFASNSTTKQILIGYINIHSK